VGTKLDIPSSMQTLCETAPGGLVMFALKMGNAKSHVCLLGGKPFVCVSVNALNAILREQSSIIN